MKIQSWQIITYFSLCLCSLYLYCALSFDYVLIFSFEGGGVFFLLSPREKILKSFICGLPSLRGINKKGDRGMCIGYIEVQGITWIEIERHGFRWCVQRVIEESTKRKLYDIIIKRQRYNQEKTGVYRIYHLAIACTYDKGSSDMYWNWKMHIKAVHSEEGHVEWWRKIQGV